MDSALAVAQQITRFAVTPAVKQRVTAALDRRLALPMVFPGEDLGIAYGARHAGPVEMDEGVVQVRKGIYPTYCFSRMV